MAKNKSVLGIYTSRSAVEAAITHLKEAGFRSSDVSILLPENLGPKELATEKATKAPEGTTARATSGAVIGGALGWLMHIGHDRHAELLAYLGKDRQRCAQAKATRAR